MKNKIKDFENKLNEMSRELQELKKQCRKTPKIGGVHEIAGIDWIVLDKLESGFFATTKDFVSTSKFDNESNNWSISNVRNWLNTDFVQKIEEDLGGESMVEFERNLISLDGQTEYGACYDKISLLTLDEYRKYRAFLPNTEKWWWTCTPWSTPGNGCKYSVAVVSPSGYIFSNVCDDGNGVRPVCIFPSSIFESEDE